MALKSIKIRKLGIEDLEQVIHIKKKKINFNLHPTDAGRFDLSACSP